MSRLREAASSLRHEGIASTAWRVGNWMSRSANPFARPRVLVYPEDAASVDWTDPPQEHGTGNPGPHYRVAWVISPPSRTSGGHQNAFRFMEYLERAGHSLELYFYQAERMPKVSVPAIASMLAATSAYPRLKAGLNVYDPTVGIAPGFDAVFAVDWPTAYAVHRYTGPAKRFYFVQDFEPWFYPASSEYILAESTYRFGFHGFSAGRWLAGKLQSEYGMRCDAYDYAVDVSRYHRSETGRRSEVLFYARPPTPRRGFELGVLALAELHRMRPEVTIHTVGWDLSGYELPFPFVNHAAVDIAQLNGIYNRCAAGLVISLTDMSLLPIELMAAGVVPVVNDGENTRGVLDSPYIRYAPLSPRAMARELVAALDAPDQAERSEAMAASVSTEAGWAEPGEQFAELFAAAMRETSGPGAPGATAQSAAS